MSASLKQPLADRVAGALRAALQRGLHRGALPPERRLCRDLGVGRSTLRDALAALTEEGHIAPGHRGRRRSILHAVRAPAPPSRVIMLTPFATADLPPFPLRLADELRSIFAAIPLPFDVRTSRAFRAVRADGFLRRLVRDEGPAVWLLLRAPARIQEWFDRNGVPAVVIGHPHPGVRLPAITENLRAAARHAAALLLSRGHKRLALLREAGDIAGHQLVEAILKEACARAAGAHLVVEQHDGTAEGAAAAVDRIARPARRPTGLMVVDAYDAVTAVTGLARKGLRVPEDMSLVVLFDDASLDRLLPPLTRYRTSRTAMARWAAETAVALASGRPPPRRRPPIPAFVAGASVVAAGVR
jgi:hypothetical protein